MRIIRRLAGAFAVTLGALVLALAANKNWTPIDRPLPPIRPGSDALRIVTMGTSLTANGTWPDDLAASLPKCLGRPVEVIRVAKAGASSAWGVSVIGEVIAARPDVVLIEFAINDADLRDGLWPSASRANHAEILSNLVGSLPTSSVALMTMNPAYGLRGWARPRLGAYYRSYDALSAIHGTGLIDLYARWLVLPNAREKLPDGLHPDPDTASALIVPAVTAAIAAPAGKACS